jgi:2-polyprenyl-3-methyl-5-hydroxy-6-metoxy-1,4-benzoquinol methylase
MAADSEPPQQVRYFDTLARLFERYAEMEADSYTPWLTAVVPDRAGRGSRAVDLGCGSGRFTGLLAERYDEVLAVDIAERLLEIARAKRARPNIRYECRSLWDVTADRDGRFDVVMCINTINHVRDHDRVLPHIRGLVSPGGHAVLVDIVYDDSRPRSRLWHYQDGFQYASRVLVHEHSPRHALAALRLRWHPTWIEHVTTSTPLSRDEFHHRYGKVFPGATFTDDVLPVLCATHWQAPARDPAGG